MAEGRRVAVTGLGAVSALGVGVAALREGTWSGRSAIAKVTLFDVSRFVAQTAAEAPAVPADPVSGAADRIGRLARSAPQSLLRQSGSIGLGL